MTKTYRPVISSQLAAELNPAFASAEPHTICKAIGKALGEFNVAEMARQTGLQRQSIYRAFQTNKQLPNFSTVLAVLTSMGLQLKVVPRVGGGNQAPRRNLGYWKLYAHGVRQYRGPRSQERCLGQRTDDQRAAPRQHGACACALRRQQPIDRRFRDKILLLNSQSPGIGHCRVRVAASSALENRRPCRRDHAPHSPCVRRGLSGSRPDPRLARRAAAARSLSGGACAPFAQPIPQAPCEVPDRRRRKAEGDPVRLVRQNVRPHQSGPKAALSRIGRALKAIEGSKDHTGPTQK